MSFKSPAYCFFLQCHNLSSFSEVLNSRTGKKYGDVSFSETDITNTSLGELTYLFGSPFL